MLGCIGIGVSLRMASQHDTNGIMASLELGILSMVVDESLSVSIQKFCLEEIQLHYVKSLQFGNCYL